MDKIFIQPACLTLIAHLLETNQVAILADFEDQELVERIIKIFLEDLRI